MLLAHANADLPSRCWVEVDLAAISANVHSYCRLVGSGTVVMGTVKADGYGHGAVAAARAALAGGASRLAVANVQEGFELRRGGIAVPVHVLGPLLPEELPAAVAHDLISSPYDAESVAWVSREALRQGKTAVVHLKIDTGMGRHGCPPAAAATLGTLTQTLPAVRLEGVFTHLAEAGDESWSYQQLAAFDAACASLRAAGLVGLMRHAANSSAAILYPASRYEAIRPGLAIYGVQDNYLARQRLLLEPALTWKTRVVQLKAYPVGHAIGYNRTFITSRPTVAALLPVGYADGYRRDFSNRADVLIRGSRCRVLGLVSMDCTVVEVTHVPEVRTGDVVTLAGADGRERITLEQLAALAPGVIPYEILTLLGRRNRWYYHHRQQRLEAA